MSSADCMGDRIRHIWAPEDEFNVSRVGRFTLTASPDRARARVRMLQPVRSSFRPPPAHAGRVRQGNGGPAQRHIILWVGEERDLVHGSRERTRQE
jgi:hypothetical protein